MRLRLGVSLIKLHLPIESLGWNFYVIGNFEGVDQPKQIGGAFRAEFVYGPAELGLSAEEADPVVVWHVQVALIVVGHIVSVVLAHRLALQMYGSRRQAVISQLPMLVLMLLFTTAGLWILSQPLVGVE